MKPKTVDDAIDEALCHPTISPRQVGPRQDVELDDQVDRRELIRNLLEDHPGATPDDLVRMLHERQIEVSSTLVLQELARL
jgi:hypothetical protein